MYPRVLLAALAVTVAAACRRPRPGVRAAVDASVLDVPVVDVPIPEASVALPPSGPEACATDADCPGGYCFTEGLEAQYSRVFRDCPDGVAWRATHPLHRCLRAGCRSDAECAAGTRCADVQMLPFPQRTCVPATCRTQWDCRARVFGRCLEYLSGRQCTPGGWACSYPVDQCAPQDHTRPCPPRPGMIARCAPRNGRFGCVYEPPPTP